MAPSDSSPPSHGSEQDQAAVVISAEASHASLPRSPADPSCATTETTASNAVRAVENGLDPKDASSDADADTGANDDAASGLPLIAILVGICVGSFLMSLDIFIIATVRPSPCPVLIHLLGYIITTSYQQYPDYFLRPFQLSRPPLDGPTRSHGTPQPTP